MSRAVSLCIFALVVPCHVNSLRAPVFSLCCANGEICHEMVGNKGAHWVLLTMCSGS